MIHVILCKGERLNKSKQLLDAIESIQIPKVEELLNSGVSPNRARNLLYILDQPLCKAVMMKSLDLVRILLNHGARVNDYDRIDFTPLQHACVLNQKEIANCLIENGADVNLFRKKWIPIFQSISCPLCYATFYGSSDLVKLLLDNGASKSAKYVWKTAWYKFDLDILEQLVMTGMAPSELVEYWKDRMKTERGIVVSPPLWRKVIK